MSQVARKPTRGSHSRRDFQPVLLGYHFLRFPDRVMLGRGVRIALLRDSGLVTL